MHSPRLSQARVTRTPNSRRDSYQGTPSQAYRRDVPYRSRAHQAPSGVSTISDLTHHGHIPARCHPDLSRAKGEGSMHSPRLIQAHATLNSQKVRIRVRLQADRKDVPYRSRAHRAPLPRHLMIPTSGRLRRVSPNNELNKFMRHG